MVTKGSFVVLLLQFYEIWRNRSIRSIMVNCSVVNYFNFLVVNIAVGFLICVIGYYGAPNSKPPGDQSVRVKKFSRELSHNRIVTSHVEYRIKKTIFFNPPFLSTKFFCQLNRIISLIQLVLWYLHFASKWGDIFSLLLWIDNFVDKMCSIIVIFIELLELLSLRCVRQKFRITRLHVIICAQFISYCLQCFVFYAQPDIALPYYRSLLNSIFYEF